MGIIKSPGPLRLCLAVVAAGACLSACGPSEQELCDQKVATLEANKREALGNIARQQGECKAVSVEFPGNQSIYAGCLETLQLTIKISQQINASVAKRYTEPDMLRCLQLRTDK